MNLNTYLKTHFSSDLEKLPKQEPNDVLKKIFGNIYCFGDKEWTKAHTDLNSIAKERWTEFVFILFVEVLIDLVNPRLVRLRRLVHPQLLPGAEGFLALVAPVCELIGADSTGRRRRGTTDDFTSRCCIL